VARVHGVALVPVLAWVPPGGDLADRRYPSAYLRKIWRDEAEQRLADAVDLAFGGAPAEVTLQPAVLRGEAGRVLVAAAIDPGDLLVVGAGRRGVIRRLAGGMPGGFAGGVAGFCLGHAVCPVVAVPPSDLAVASRGLRGWALRHRSLTPEAAHPHAAESR
jgi:nucleotide-binding universal stress UspA family protein